jgi:hypothetical protein
MNISDMVQVVLSVLTVVGAMAAVRYEVRSRVDGLNKEVVALQDRKIALLTAELGAERAMREKQGVEIAELKATVEEQARTIARLEREKRATFHRRGAEDAERQEE